MSWSAVWRLLYLLLLVGEIARLALLDCRRLVFAHLLDLLIHALHLLVELGILVLILLADVGNLGLGRLGLRHQGED